MAYSLAELAPHIRDDAQMRELLVGYARAYGEWALTLDFDDVIRRGVAVWLKNFGFNAVGYMGSGGVLSGVGKGVVTASLGKLLTEYGYKTTLIKADPYINYDAGTLRPTEHGEVWVTGDGGEIDQDLGTYERFLDQDIPKQNNITTGQIFIF